MKIKSSRLLAIGLAGVFSTAGSAFATNGYFMIGFGTGSVGMGGIGVTSPQDSMCVGGNPACLGEFETPRFDMSVGFIDPRRASGTTVMGAGAQPGGIYNWSGVNTYILPGMGFVFPFNDKLAFGFAALGNGGAGTTYKPNFFTGNNNEYLGVDLVQLIVPITVTYKFDKTNTFGMSIVPARQRFIAQGLSPFAPFSTDKDHLTDKGHDYANGIGARVGWAGHFLDNKLTLGATYASKIYMQKFNLYKGLFAGAGGFDVPANYAVGIGFKPVENLTVALDIQKILYSGIPSVGNRGPTPVGNGNLPTTCDPTVAVGVGNCSGTSLGAPEGSGFGWVDQTVYKLGVAYTNFWPSLFGANKLTVRAGYNYGKTPIQQDQLLFNLLAPATSEKHYTVGFTYSLGEQSIFGFGSEGALSMAYIESPLKKLEGPAIGTSGDTGIASFQMKQKILDIAYTLKF